MEDGMVKLYFEEIPPVEDDDAEGISAIQYHDEVEACEAVSGKQHRTVRMGEDGEIADVQLEGFGACEEEAVVLPVEYLCLEARKGNVAKRGGASISCIGNNVFVFGGASRDGVHYNDMWSATLPGNWNSEKAKEETNSHTDQFRWENISTKVAGTPPEERSGHSATSMEVSESLSWILFFGGLNAMKEKVYNDLNLFCQKNGEMGWHSVESQGMPPAPRTEHSATLFGSNVFVFGGSSPMTGPLRDLHVLDISGLVKDDGSISAVCNWSTVRCLGPPPEPRELHSACILYASELSKKKTVPFPRSYGDRELDPVLEDSVDRFGPESESESAKSEATKFREEGNASFVRGDFKKACDLYTEALKRYPRCHLTYGNRSACHLKLEKLDDALKDAICAIRINPCWGKGYFREAQACMALGKYNEALTAVQAAVECSSSDHELASMQKQKEEFEQKFVDSGSEDSRQSSIESGKPALGLYIFGGRGTDKVLRDISVLNLETMVWAPAQETSYPRCGHSATCIDNNRFLVFGGWNGGSEVFNTAQIYDRSSQMWVNGRLRSSKNGRVVCKRFSHASCAISESSGGGIACFGGVSFESDQNDLVLLRVALEEEESLPTPSPEIE